MSREPAPGEKPLYWMGSALADLKKLPDTVIDEFGTALGVAQFGGKHPTAKPWKGEGPGVFELVEAHHGNAYRAVYTVRFERAVYVLHAFQKKSRIGKKTTQSDVELVHQRLIAARRHYEATYEAKEKD